MVTWTPTRFALADTRRPLALLTLLVCVAAVLALVGLDRVQRQQQSVQNLIEARTGLRLRYRDLQVHLGWYGPEAYLGGVELDVPGFDATRLQARELVLRFDVWKLLRKARLDPTRVTLRDVDFDLTSPAVRARSGTRHAASGRAVAPGWYALLERLPETSVELERLTLRVPSQWLQPNAAPSTLSLHAAQVSIQRSAKALQLSGNLTLPQSAGGTARLQARWEWPLAARFAAAKGTATLRAAQLHTSWLESWRPEIANADSFRVALPRGDVSADLLLRAASVAGGVLRFASANQDLLTARFDTVRRALLLDARSLPVRVASPAGTMSGDLNASMAGRWIAGGIDLRGRLGRSDWQASPEIHDAPPTTTLASVQLLGGGVDVHLRRAAHAAQWRVASRGRLSLLDLRLAVPESPGATYLAAAGVAWDEQQLAFEARGGRSGPLDLLTTRWSRATSQWSVTARGAPVDALAWLAATGQLSAQIDLTKVVTPLGQVSVELRLPTNLLASTTPADMRIAVRVGAAEQPLSQGLLHWVREPARGAWRLERGDWVVGRGTPRWPATPQLRVRGRVLDSNASDVAPWLVAVVGALPASLPLNGDVSIRRLTLASEDLGDLRARWSGVRDNLKAALRADQWRATLEHQSGHTKLAISAWPASTHRFSLVRIDLHPTARGFSWQARAPTLAADTPRTRASGQCDFSAQHCSAEIHADQLQVPERVAALAQQAGAAVNGSAPDVVLALALDDDQLTCQRCKLYWSDSQLSVAGGLDLSNGRLDLRAHMQPLSPDNNPSIWDNAIATLTQYAPTRAAFSAARQFTPALQSALQGHRGKEIRITGSLNAPQTCTAGACLTD